MNEKELDMLATHLGHDVKTHKENYRLAHSTRELTAVSIFVKYFSKIDLFLLVLALLFCHKQNVGFHKNLFSLKGQTCKQ